MRFWKRLKPEYVSDDVFDDYHKHSWKSLTETLEEIVISSPALPNLSILSDVPILDFIASTDKPLMRKKLDFINVITWELNGGHSILLGKPNLIYSDIKAFIERIK